MRRVVRLVPALAAAAGLLVPAACERELVGARIEAACGRLLSSPRAPPGQSDPDLIMQAVGLDPERTRWEEIQQAFWPGYRVYRMEHGIEPLSELVAALDPERRVIRLTNDRPVSRQQLARRCFNFISRSESVAIDQHNYEAYLRFFFQVHVGRAGQFLRDRDDAEQASRHLQYTFRHEGHLARLREVTEPQFERVSSRGGFAAVSYNWDHRRGVIYEYAVSAAADGIASIDRSIFGIQQWRSDVAGGSCFAVSPDGLIATAYHVIDDASETIMVRFEMGREVEAIPIGLLPEYDLALLWAPLETPHYLSLATEARQGEAVFMLGFPSPSRDLWEPSYTAGTIIGLSDGRPWSGRIRSSVPGRRGNSGAPLVNARGEAVAVHVASARESADSPRIGIEVASHHIRPLFPSAPPPLPPAWGEAAIERAQGAVCEIETLSLR